MGSTNWTSHVQHSVQNYMKMLMPLSSSHVTRTLGPWQELIHDAAHSSRTWFCTLAFVCLLLFICICVGDGEEGYFTNFDIEQGRHVVRSIYSALATCIHDAYRLTHRKQKVHPRSIETIRWKMRTLHWLFHSLLCALLMSGVSHSESKYRGEGFFSFSGQHQPPVYFSLHQCDVFPIQY